MQRDLTEIRGGRSLGSVRSGPGSAARSHAGMWRLFLGSILFASLFPMITIPATQHFLPNERSSYYLLYVLAAVGANFHVGATGWFFSDPAMRSHFYSHPTRYFLVPLLLIIGTALLFYFSDNVTTGYFFDFFGCWLLWHYQKQNVGILGFVGAATDGTSLSVWERRTLALAAVAGIAGNLRHWSAGLPPQTNTGLPPSFDARLPPMPIEAFNGLNVGVLLLCLLPIFIVIAVVKTPALRTNKLRMGFFLFGSLFFLPVFLFSDSVSAFAPYALAHGWQYVVFMTFVSVNQKAPFASVLILLIVSTMGFLLLDSHPQIREWLGILDNPLFTGAIYGIVMSHFVLDAKIWRLREPFQRKYMRDKFYFIFRQ